MRTFVNSPRWLGGVQPPPTKIGIGEKRAVEWLTPPPLLRMILLGLRHPSENGYFTARELALLPHVMKLFARYRHTPESRQIVRRLLIHEENRGVFLHGAGESRGGVAQPVVRRGRPPPFRKQTLERLCFQVG